MNKLDRYSLTEVAVLQLRGWKHIMTPQGSAINHSRCIRFEAPILQHTLGAIFLLFRSCGVLVSILVVTPICNIIDGIAENFTNASPHDTLRRNAAQYTEM